MTEIEIDYTGIDKYYDIVNISASSIYNVARKSGVKAIQPELKRELQASGMVALLEAWNSFDKDKKTTFKTYAFYRIRGAMFDHLRYEDTVSRSIRSKLKTIVLGLDKTISSEQLSQKQIDSTLKQSTTVLQFLPTNEIETLNGKSESQMDFPDESNHQCDIDIQETVNKLLALCPLLERERLIIYEYYFNDKSFSSIGQELNITESRVSQVHRAAIMKLEQYV